MDERGKTGTAGPLGMAVREGLPGWVYMLLTAFLWSTGGILIKLIPGNAIAINGARCLIALIFFSLYRKSWKIRINRMVAAAGFCLMMTNTLFVVSNKLTSAANAIVLQYMAPIFVLIWDCIYRKQALKKQQLLIVGMAFCGMVLFFFDRLGGGHLLGNLLAIVSGLCFSGVFFINSLPGSCSEDASMLGFLLSVVISVPFLGTVAGMDGTAYAALAALGIFQVGLAYVLFSEGSRRMNPVGASLIGMLEAVLNPLWVLLFYGEKMGGFALLGGTVILTAVAFGTLQTEQKG